MASTTQQDSPRRRGRPKGTGTRANEALALVRDKPGITIPEIAAKMGIKQNYLYRVLPSLATDGLVEKDGRGWRPKGASPPAKPPAAVSPIAPPENGNGNGHDGAADSTVAAAVTAITAAGGTVAAALTAIRETLDGAIMRAQADADKAQADADEAQAEVQRLVALRTDVLSRATPTSS